MRRGWLGVGDGEGGGGRGGYDGFCVRWVG